MLASSVTEAARKVVLIDALVSDVTSTTKKVSSAGINGTCELDVVVPKCQGQCSHESGRMEVNNTTV